MITVANKILYPGRGVVAGIYAVCAALTLTGCISFPKEALEQQEQIFGERLEENVVLCNIPLNKQQRAAKTFAWIVTPFELPGVILLDTLFIPLELLDFQVPDYTFSAVWIRGLFENNAAKLQADLIEYPWGLSSIPLKKCMEEAYTGERDEALRRADRLVKAGNFDNQCHFTIPIRVYLLLGEEDRAVSAIHEYARNVSRWPVWTPTDVLDLTPLFGVIPGIAADEAWTVGRDTVGFCLVVRYVCDRGYSGILDAQVLASLQKINRSLPWQLGIDLLPLEMMTSNNEQAYDRTLELAATALAAQEAEFAQHDRKDAYDRNHINVAMALPMTMLPTPLYIMAASKYAMEFPPSDMIVPGKYVLALCYLEQIRALCILDRAADAEQVLPKLREVTEGRDWYRWVRLEGEFLVALAQKNFARAAELDRALIKDCLANAQFVRLLNMGKRRGEAFESAGQPEYALQSYRGVIDALDSLYKQAGQDTVLSESFNREHLPFYHRVIELSVELKKPPAEILLLAERTKSRILSQSLLAKSSEADHIVPEHQEAYRLLLAQYRAQRVQAAALANPRKRDRAQRSADHVRSELRRLEQLSGEKGGARTGVLTELSGQDALKALRQADTSLVYWLGDKFSLCFRCQPSGEVTMTRLPGRARFQKLVTRYRDLLRDPKSDPMGSEEGRELAGYLVPGGQVGGHTLIVPDKELYLLPFEALPVETEYLVSKTQTSYAPSLSVAVALSERKPQKPERQLLALANPMFGSAEEGLVAQTFKRSGVSLAPLPGTQKEIEAIAQTFKDADTLSGTGATESAFRSQDPSKFKYLHFATHGLLGDDAIGPGEPALALASPTKKTRKREDGFLSASEIVQMELRAELVTLSACNTAAGKLSTGDGVASLASAFLSAGADGVVVSTWAVADVATAELMASFYRNLGAGDDVPEALRKAKLALMGKQQAAGSGERGLQIVGARKDAKLSHPYYWAPFIHVGSLPDLGTGGRQ